MKLKAIQLLVVIDQLIKHSEISRNWCINNGVTTRLGAYMCYIKKYGVDFIPQYTDGREDFVYYLVGDRSTEILKKITKNTKA